MAGPASLRLLFRPRYPSRWSPLLPLVTEPADPRTPGCFDSIYTARESVVPEIPLPFLLCTTHRHAAYKARDGPKIMPSQRGVRGGTSVSPLYTIAGVLVLGGAIGLWQRRPAETAEPAEAASSAPTASALTMAPPLSAAEACRNVGYLCADLERSGRLQIRRFKDFA